MGNKIQRPSQLAKATVEFDNGNYSKAMLILKEELRFQPRSMEALRLYLKAHFRLYELDKVEEVYSKFYEAQHIPEDIITKTLMVKEMFWYDEGKARGYAKDLQAMVKKELEKSSNSLAPVNNNNNNQSVQNKRVGDNIGNNSNKIASNTNIMISNNNNNSNFLNNNNTLHHPGNILLSNNSNVFSSSGQPNNSKLENQTANNDKVNPNGIANDNIYEQHLSLSRAWCMYIDCNYEKGVNIIQLELLSQQSLIFSPQQIRFEATILLALLYNKQRLFSSSISLLNEQWVLQQISLSKDKEFEVGIYLGETFSLQGKLESSMEKYRISSELIPQNIYILYRMFSLSLRMNDLKQSRYAIDRAAKLKPNDSIVFKMQGDQYAVMKDSKSAMRMYDKGITVNKNCFRCLEALGDVSAQESQRITYYERCAKANPCYTDVMIKIGIYYIQFSDDYLEALRWFFKAVENRTQHKLIYFYISRSYYQNDQYQYALKNLNISLNLTYEKINDQLSLAVKIINKYGEFFVVEDINEFILGIRFKYFQYFQTLAENLENVKFAKLFLENIQLTQAHLHYFALYKTILGNLPAKKDISPNEIKKSIVSPQKQRKSNGAIPILINQHSFAPSQDAWQVRTNNNDSNNNNSTSNHGTHHGYLLKQVFTPYNEEAVQIAQKYYFDLFS